MRVVVVLLLAAALLLSSAGGAHSREEEGEEGRRAFAAIPVRAAPKQPQQIHLALTGQDNELTFMWADGASKAKKPAVELCDPTCRTIAAQESQHYDAPLFYKSPEFRICKVGSLTPGGPLRYRVGDSETGGVWSDWFETHAPRPSGLSSLKDSPFVFGVVGDNGVSPHSHRVAEQLALEGNASAPGSRKFEMLVHPGDISYANGVQHYWDEWGNMVQPFAAYRPWMVAPGNHEIFDAFVPYLYRFKMPSKESHADFGNMYYSWNVGPVHLIALNSESLEFWHSDDPMGQYEWLKKDLAGVDRSITPWVMSFWHTPWYCSNTHHQGSGADMRKSYEDIFHQYSVDIVFTGHVHAYERTYPVFQGKRDASGPVYLTVGTGGNHEGLYDSWIKPIPEWSAARDGKHYGYGSFTIFNATHATWEFVGDSDLKQVLDTATFVRPASRSPRLGGKSCTPQGMPCAPDDNTCCSGDCAYDHGKTYCN